MTASINHVDINYAVQDADTTLDLVATGLANTINASPNLVDVITANASGAEITISADAAGVPFTLETNTTNNGNDDSQASTAAVVTANATRYQLQSSGSITFTDLDLTDTSNVTRSFVSASGADLSDALSTALQNLESAFIISGAGVGSAAHSGTINWEFSIDNALTQYLAADQSIDVTYRITVTDDSNITAGDEINVESEDVVITINGANDNPVLSVSSLDNSDTETLTETNAALTTSGTLTATDIDLANTASITHISVSRGDTTDGLISNDTELLNMLSVTPEQVLDGTQTINQFTWTFNSNPTANANSESFDYLANGETLTLTYRLTLSDQESGTTPILTTSSSPSMALMTIRKSLVLLTPLR